MRSQPQEPAGCNKAKPIEQAKRRGAAVHCAGAERAQWAMQRGGGGAGNRAMCCGQKPAVQRDNFRARNGRWFEPGRGSRVGQGCALFKTSGSGRNVSHTAPPALLFPAKSCGAAFRGGPFYCASGNRCAFPFAKQKRPCALTAARTGGGATVPGDRPTQTVEMTAAEKRSLLKKAELFLDGEQFRPFFAKKQRRGPFAS